MSKNLKIKANTRLGAGNSSALRQYKQTITLNAIQKEVIVGTLLGNASMPLYRGKPKLHFKFEQNIASAYYIHHLYDIFPNPVGRPGRETRSGDPVGRPGRETLLERLHEYAIIVAVAPVMANLCGFKLTVTFGLSEFKFYD